MTRTRDLDPVGRTFRRACFGAAATVLALLGLGHVHMASLEPAAPPPPHTAPATYECTEDMACWRCLLGVVHSCGLTP